MRAYIWDEEYDYYIFVGDSPEEGQKLINERVRKEIDEDILRAAKRRDKLIATEPKSIERLKRDDSLEFYTDQDFQNFYEKWVKTYEEQYINRTTPSHIVEAGVLTNIDHVNE